VRENTRHSRNCSLSRTRATPSLPVSLSRADAMANEGRARSPSVPRHTARRISIFLPRAGVARRPRVSSPRVAIGLGDGGSMHASHSPNAYTEAEGVRESAEGGIRDGVAWKRFGNLRPFSFRRVVAAFRCDSAAGAAGHSANLPAEYKG